MTTGQIAIIVLILLGAGFMLISAIGMHHQQIDVRQRTGSAAPDPSAQQQPFNPLSGGQRSAATACTTRRCNTCCQSARLLRRSV